MSAVLKWQRRWSPLCFLPLLCVVCLYVCASVCVPVRVSVSVYLSLCVQVNGVDIAGVGQEELVCMLRSTRQGECVCLGVLRQDEMFLPRELVRPNNCPPSATPDRAVANRMGLFNWLDLVMNKPINVSTTHAHIRTATRTHTQQRKRTHAYTHTHAHANNTKPCIPKLQQKGQNYENMSVLPWRCTAWLPIGAQIQLWALSWRPKYD